MRTEASRYPYMLSPFFTVVITTYNRADLLVKAIESVLNQTFTGYELIIVDDASPDNTEQIVQHLIARGNTGTSNQQGDSINQADEPTVQPQVSYSRFPTNNGVKRARQEGAKQARGEFLVYLDDDDKLMPDFLEQVYAVVKDIPATIGFAIPAYRMFKYTDDGEVLMKEHNYNCTEPTAFAGGQYIKKAIGGGSGLIVRTAAVNSVGGWLSDFSFGEDTEFMLRLASQWDWMIIPAAILVFYNLQRPQLTQNNYRYAKALEQLADVHADKFIPFPKTRRGYYLGAARMYYALKAYPDGRRAIWKAVKMQPLAPGTWKFCLKLHIATLFPTLFPTMFINDRHGPITTISPEPQQ